MVMATTPVTIGENLAFVANELPWERERAIAALDIVTQKNGDRATGLVRTLRSPPNPNGGVEEVRKYVKPEYQAEAWQDSAAATSYFFSMEYKARVSVNELLHEYCNAEVVRRATLIQVALAAYRAEHGTYPDTPAMLAPDFLPAVPMDPFSMQPFRYFPKGLDLPLTGFNFGEDGQTEKWISAGTPLLWSVGINDVQLTVRQIELWPKEESDEVAIAGVLVDADRGNSVRRTSEHYSLQPANVGTWWFWESARRLMFELPK